MTDRNTGHITFILGGAKSGKSRYAESICVESELSRLYIATGQAFDDEMKNRIQRHQEDRGSNWQTIEETHKISNVIAKYSAPDNIILVDCLTLWITNLMMSEDDIESTTQELCSALTAAKGPVVLVSNEVGQGIVPENKMAREFRDHAGKTHQAIAAIADQVYFITAGLAQQLK